MLLLGEEKGACEHPRLELRMSMLWCFVLQSKEIQLPTGRDGLGGVASDDGTGGSDGFFLHFSNFLSSMLGGKSVFLGYVTAEFYVSREERKPVLLS